MKNPPEGQEIGIGETTGNNSSRWAGKGHSNKGDTDS